MEAIAVLVGVAITLYVIVGPAMGIVASRRLRRIQRLSDGFRRQIESLEDEMARLSPDFAATRVRPTHRPEPEPEALGPEAEQEPEVRARAERGTSEGTAPAEPSPSPWPQRGPEPISKGELGLERRLASRWLVWLGGVSIALASTFLVKYTIDQELLSPTARVVSGFFLGIVLIIGGEWLRRRPLQTSVSTVNPDYVPPAFAAAGLFSAFASVYAAFELYGLLSPPIAFAALAAVSGAGVALSLRQGQFVSLLALSGGFVTPILIPSDEPSAWALFGYLFALSVASNTVVRFKGWLWLAWVSLASAISWVLLWFTGGLIEGSAPAIGTFLLGLAALYFFVYAQQLRLLPAPSFLLLLRSPNSPQGLAWVAAGSAAVLMLGLAELDSYGFWTVATLATLAALYLAAGRWNQCFDGLSIIAAVIAALLVAMWDNPELVTLRSPLFTIEGRGFGVEPGPLVPPELVPFVSTATGLTILFGLGGFLALWGAKRPALWAGISASMPVLLLAIVYARVSALNVDFRWAAVALVVAVTGSTAVAVVERHRNQPGLNGALGAYAAGAVAALSLGVAMALEQAWLTVALSLQLPVLAWLSRELDLRLLRIVAALLAIAVLARLVLNADIFEYQLGDIPGLNWLLYGYGVPAISFFVAARWFRRVRDDYLVSLLEAGAIAFVVLLVSMELRSIIEGSINSARYGLLEQSAQSIAWLAIAYGIATGYKRDKRIVSLWACRILVGAAAAQVVFLQALVSNPLWSGEPVGRLFVLNVLSLAYLVPAIFIIVLSPHLRWMSQRPLAIEARWIGLSLLLLYLSLEIRHLFHGPRLDLGPTTNAELYTYSVVWLASGGSLLALGLRRRSVQIRYASLAIVMATVAKVFLWDMSSLDGLYRVASFFGLGLSLIAIAYAYQRLAIVPSRPPDSGHRETSLKTET